MKNNILIVAAHPDDEVLGMGGTIARHVAAGDDVAVVFLGDGVGSRGKISPEAVSNRRKHAEEACRILGARIMGFETFPDNRFDSVPLLDIIKIVERSKKEIHPGIVYTHHGGDLNIDHRVACQAVMTAFRPVPGEVFAEIRCFEVNSSTEWGGVAGLIPFVPDTYVDISDYLDILLQAYGCYENEVCSDPHARSLESIRTSAMYRGRQVGVFAAEAFETIKRVIR